MSYHYDNGNTYTDLHGNNSHIGGGFGVQNDHGNVGLTFDHSSSGANSIGGTGTFHPNDTTNITGSYTHTDFGNGHSTNTISGSLNYHPTDNSTIGLSAGHTDYGNGYGTDFGGFNASIGW